MRKFIRVLLIVIVVLVVGVVGLLAYVKKALPNAGPVAEVKIKSDSASIANGKYLASHVAGCIDCHSPRNFEQFGMPRIESQTGAGGLPFTHDMGLPGNFFSRNITPASLSNWTDGQLFHTVTTGIDSKGEPLFPIMPFQRYAMADSNDILDILAYIRTLAPVKSSVPSDDADFPMNFIMRTIPQKPHFTVKPAEDDTIAYGKYLVNLAACQDCHTPMDHGNPIEGMEFAGGKEFHLKGCGTVTAYNITPDPETGIGKWDKNTFIQAFKYFDNEENHHIPWQKRGYQTVMPWLEYSGMKESDLGAIYSYLRTLPPVKNKITRFVKEGDAEVSKETSMK